MTVEECLIEDLACSESFYYFLTNHCRTIDYKHNEDRPFPKWPYIKRVCKLYQEDPNNIIVLKSSQILMTWILSGFALWRLKYAKHYSGAMFSRVGQAASDMTPQGLMGRIKYIYDRLPGFLKESIEFLQHPAKCTTLTGNSMHFFNSSDDAGRGFSGTEALLDEWAFHEHSDLIFNSIAPRVRRIIGISTPNGDADTNQFYQIWKNQENNFTHIEIGWEENPEFDYKRACANLNNDPNKIAVELNRSFTANLHGLIFAYDRGKHGTMSLTLETIKREIRPQVIYGGCDLGYGDDTAFLLGYIRKVQNENDQWKRILYIYWDYSKDKLTPEEHAYFVRQALEQYKSTAGYVINADPSGQNRMQNGGQSLFDDYRDNEILLSPGNNDVRLGISKIQELLLSEKIQFAPNCDWIQKAISQAAYPTTHGRVNTKSEKYVHNKFSHILDALRYLVLGVADELSDRDFPRTPAEYISPGQGIGRR